MPLILVVEQEQRYVERISEALSSQGWQVEGVRDRATAVKHVADQAASLVVVNSEVPESGELIKTFSRSHGGPGTVVLIPENAADGASRLGADEVVKKPFTAQDIRQAVRRCLIGVPAPASAEEQAPIAVQTAVTDSASGAAEHRLTSEDIFGDVVSELEAALSLGTLGAAGSATAASPEVSEVAEPEPEVAKEPAAEAHGVAAEISDAVEAISLVPSEVADSAEDLSVGGAAADAVIADAPLEESPVEEAPVEKAAVEKAPVEKAAAEEAAVEVAVDEPEEVESTEDVEVVAAREEEVEEEPAVAVAAETAVEEAEVEVEEEPLPAVEEETEIEIEAEEEEEVEPEAVEDLETEAVEEEAEDEEPTEEPAEQLEEVVRLDPAAMLDARIRQAADEGTRLAAAQPSSVSDAGDSARTTDDLLRRALMGLDQPDDALAVESQARATPEEVDQLVSTVVPVEEAVEEEIAPADEGAGEDEEARHEEIEGVLEVVEGTRQEGSEYGTRLKLIWAVIIIVVLILLGFIFSRSAGGESSPADASPQAAIEAPATPVAGEAEPNTSESSQQSGDVSGAQEGADSEEDLRRELEAQRRQLQEEISKSRSSSDGADGR